MRQLANDWLNLKTAVTAIRQRFEKRISRVLAILTPTCFV